MEATIELMLLPFAADFLVLTPPVMWLRAAKWRYLKELRRDPSLPFFSVRVKPFDCESCLTYWASLLITMAYNMPLSDVVILPMTLAWAAMQIRKHLPVYL